MQGFGDRFRTTGADRDRARYVRMRPQNFAGSLGGQGGRVQGAGLGRPRRGWRDIEIVRLPTGAPSVRLHGRAKTRAEQLGMGRIAVSISHEGDYAVAIAFGMPHRGWQVRLPARHPRRARRPWKAIIARMQQLRDMERESRAAADQGASSTRERCVVSPAAARPGRPQRNVRHGGVRRWLARLRRRGPPLAAAARAGRAWPRDAGRAAFAPAGLRRAGAGGDYHRPARRRRRGRHRSCWRPEHAVNDRRPGCGGSRAGLPNGRRLSSFVLGPACAEAAPVVIDGGGSTSRWRRVVSGGVGAGPCSPRTRASSRLTGRRSPTTTPCRRVSRG